MLNRIIALMVCAGVLSACTLNAPIAPTTAPPEPTLSPAPQPTVPTARDGWLTVADGLETRNYTPADLPLGELIAVRIDPTRYRFRVHYRAGDPLTLNGWRAELPSALMIVNTNFFDPQNEILGLLVADGVRYGAPYTTRGGTFGIVDGRVQIRANTRNPFTSEVLEQAVQGFPLLVDEGVQTYTQLSGDRATRRTVIALDRQGRVVVLVTPLIGLRLAELSAFLSESELDILTAFNLDGGGSTLLSLAEVYTLTSRDPVPAVLAVYHAG